MYTFQYVSYICKTHVIFSAHLDYIYVKYIAYIYMCDMRVILRYLVHMWYITHMWHSRAQSWLKYAMHMCGGPYKCVWYTQKCVWYTQKCVWYTHKCILSVWYTFKCI